MLLFAIIPCMSTYEDDKLFDRNDSRVPVDGSTNEDAFEVATSASNRRARGAAVALTVLTVGGLFVPQVINGVRETFFGKSTQASAAPANTPYTQRTDVEGYIAAHRPTGCTETLASLGATTLTGAAQELDARYKDGQGDGSLEAIRNVMSDELKEAGLSSSEISQHTAQTFEFDIPQPFCIVDADRPVNAGANPVGE